LTGGCLTGVLILSLSVLLFAYGYQVGLINHPGSYAYVRVRGEEMRPTIRSGDVVLVDRNHYDPERKPVKRGDIVWIEPTPEMEREGRFLLRVAGLPGETVSFDASGEMRINGKPLDGFPRTAGIIYRTTGELAQPHSLRTNEFFLIGDNPSYWSDKRAGGVIPMKNLRGKAASILFPPNRIGSLYPSDD